MRLPKASASAPNFAVSPPRVLRQARDEGQWPDYESPFCAGPMLMDPANRSVDHPVFEIRIVRQRLKNPLSYALARPSPETRVDSEPFAEPGR